MNKKIITATLVLGLLTSTTSFAFPFNDTSDPSVDYAYQNNLMKGMTPTTFAPNTTLTRGQFATVLANLTKETPTGTMPFNDVQKGAFYYYPVLWAYNNKIISGTTDKTFSPNDTLNREQVASMVTAYWKKYLDMIDLEETNTKFLDNDNVSEWAKESVAFSGQIFKDADIVKGSTFDPKRPFTRLEVAKLISHLDKLERPIPVEDTQQYNKPNYEPPMNDYIRLNNSLTNSWLITIQNVSNESYTATKEETILLNAINKERKKLGLNELKLMKDLKTIANVRVKELHTWYKKYAFDRLEAPKTNANPYERNNAATFYEQLTKNNDIFKNTKFYQFIDSNDKTKIMQKTFTESFAETALHGSDKDNINKFVDFLINSPFHYTIMVEPEYTHVAFAKQTDNGRTTWVQIYFDQNAGKGILKVLPLN